MENMESLEKASLIARRDEVEGEEEDCEPTDKRASGGCCSAGSSVHCVPKRYVFLLLGFLGFLNLYTLRLNLSVAVVQMDADTASLRNGSARVSNGVCACVGECNMSHGA